MKVSGTFLASGSAINVNIGFIPDYVELFEFTSDPEIVYRWYRCLAERDAATGATFMYGIPDDGAGVITASQMDTALEGIIAYDADDQAGHVLIENPSTHRLEAQSVSDWLTSTNYSTGGTDRSATVVGTIIRPIIHNGYVYELITGTGAGTGEPTWGTVPGETSTDDGSNIFMCREENVAKDGGMGFTIGATVSVDDDMWVFKAERHDRMGDMGDAAGAQPTSFRKGA